MLYIAVIIFAVLLGLLLWSLRNSTTSRQGAFPLEDAGGSNLQYFPQIHQALAIEDRRFLLAHGGAKMARTVYRERRGVARDFLKALEEEFDHLMRLAKVIAVLSPEVETLQEFERLRLGAIFRCQLLVIRTRLAFGAPSLPQVTAVGDRVSRLAVLMETAMKELGERAALATELASANNRGDVDFA